MAIFHDEEDGPIEPQRGLPAPLPADETLIWQGRPKAMALAVHALHIRFIAAYFLIVALFRTGLAARGGGDTGDLISLLGTTMLFGGLAVAAMIGISWLMARKAVFTLTDKRVVIRHGIAIPKYINLPFERITGLSLRAYRGGFGDIALATGQKASVPYFHLWPFARPMRFTKTVPLLRALPDAGNVAALLAETMRTKAPELFTHGADVKSTPVQQPKPADAYAATALAREAAAS
ncbi:MAG: photosynthetic complex putative assembly protein PuhB [Pseudomonadota bacterium]